MQGAPLISPLIRYMLEQKMICDVTAPIAAESEQVQFTFTASGVFGLQIWKPYYFAPDDAIDNSIIKGIEVLTGTQLFPYPNGGTPLSSADLLGQFLLWIVDKKDDVLCQIPLSSLQSTPYGATGHASVQRFHLKDVIWQNCYITCHDTTNVNVGDSILFNVYYDPLTPENNGKS